MRFHASICIAAIAGLWAAGGSARAENLGQGWTWRRPLIFKQVTSDAPGENVAWAEFYINSDHKADGSDIRVTTADRTIVPHRVMQVDGANDFLRVAFATKGDGPYYVWWGNPNAEKPANELDVKRGMFLEVFNNARGGAGAPALNAVPGPLIASFVMPEVDLGYNPAGDDRQVMLHYTGQFKIDTAITAQIAFTVNDSGILSIDGREIDRQIRTGLKSQVRSSVPAELAVGWHTLDIRQVNQNQQNVVMALAWQRPGEKAFSALPSSLFAQASHAVAGPLEKPGTAYSADISVEATAEAFLPPSSYGQRYTFEAQYPESMRPTLTWDFGDGQTTTGLKKSTHIFLSPGIYPVTVKIDGNGISRTATVRLPVKDRLYEKFPRPPEDPIPTVRGILKEYKPEKLPGDQAFRGMVYFESSPGGTGIFGESDLQLTWGRAWLAAKETTSSLAEGTVFDETFALARLLESKKDFAGAAEVYRLAAAKPIKMETRTNLLRHEVMALCDADDADGAVKEAREWLKKISVENHVQVQTIQVALAYALIATGDGKGAKAAIDAAEKAVGSGAAAGTDAFNRQQIRQGVLTRNVENYLRTKDFDTAHTLLNQWELEMPAALWEGFTRTLRVKLAAAEGQPLIAARMALAHARANPDGFYAAELLYRASENFKTAGDNARAKTALDLLSTKYPESPYAQQNDPAGK